VDGGGNVNIASAVLDYHVFHHVDAGLSLDAWVIRGMYRLYANGERYYGGVSATLVSSVWEAAIWDPGPSPGWMGGTHGHQTVISATLYSDGVEVALDAASATSSSHVQLVQVSGLHRIDDAVKVATLTTTWTWSGADMSQRTVIDWDQDHTPTVAYLGMFPIKRKIATVQVTSSAEFLPGGPVVDVSEPGHGETHYANRSRIHISDPGGIDFLVSHGQSGVSIKDVFVSDAEAYNKVYCDRGGNAVTAGEQWTTTTDYRWLG
jgi:hypothetical protein